MKPIEYRNYEILFAVAEILNDHSITGFAPVEPYDKSIEVKRCNIDHISVVSGYWFGDGLLSSKIKVVVRDVNKHQLNSSDIKEKIRLQLNNTYMYDVDVVMVGGSGEYDTVHVEKNAIHNRQTC